jgi:class 3 adenylate cyclase
MKQYFIPDYFVPARYRKGGTDKLRKARLLVQVSFLTSLFSAFYLALHLAWGMYWSTLAMALNAGYFLLLPFLFKWGMPRAWAVNSYVLMGVIGVFIASAAQRYLESSVMIYFALLPVTGILLENKRTGLFWTFIGYGCVMLNGWLYYNGIGLGDELPPEHHVLYVTNGFAGFVLIVFWVVWVFQKTTERALLQVEKEKRRSDELLLNILPEEVAEELKETGSANAKEYGEVSVLFTDFVNFTSISESIGAQATVQELNACFTVFDAIIDRNGLEKIKTIGDAYMAVCGLPLANPIHAERTVQAALEIRDFIGERNISGHELGVRIGIHSGPVVAGIVGVKKFAYDIWGDTVNTAARMEQAGELGRVNISGATYELVKDRFSCSHRGLVEAKNKGAIDMYFVERPNIVKPVALP